MACSVSAITQHSSDSVAPYGTMDMNLEKPSRIILATWETKQPTHLFALQAQINTAGRNHKP